MNKVILVGNLGRDPEIRQMPSGDKVANLAIATSEKWRDREGNHQERTEWHRVVLFGKVAEIAEQYLHKGAKVLIEGQLRTRKWQQDGQDRYTTEVVVVGFGGTMTMLDSRVGSAGATQDGGYGDSAASSSWSAPPKPSSPEPRGGVDLDDEIPF